MFSKLADQPRPITEERSQARARVFFSVLAFLYLCLLSLYKPEAIQVPLLWLLLIPVAVFGYALTQLCYLDHASRFSRWRQRLTITLDITVSCFAMAAAGEWGAVWYPLILWIVVGHGMRFGLSYMQFAIGVAVPCFAAALSFSDYWSQNRLAGVGLLLGIIILPAFFSTLLRRLHDVNGQLELELERTAHLANHDSLTGLANRLRFYRRLENEVNRAQRGNQQFAILFMDLDRFKAVNDQYGHDAGDKLLIEVAQRIRKVVRNTDLAARLGGDEFGFITVAAENTIGADRLKQRLEEAIGAPYHINGNDILIGTSIGIARFPENGDDIDNLLNYSDHTMYQLKNGKTEATHALHACRQQTPSSQP